MSHHGVLAAQEDNCFQGCIKRRVARGSREVILPLYSTLLKPHLEYCIQLWMSQHKKEQVQKMDKDDQRARVPLLRDQSELSFFNLEMKRLQGGLIAAFQYLKEPTRKMDTYFLVESVAIGQRVMILT
ncbi:hypothetical protein WISP_55801 [Willisornis vidua]|uniref:Uncharacterized protein n=1 Tax=Willisornis vidua TaxID=1566151 RepID=A0ABQ9DIB8_9PASS|nr:hypothetical protein WISP_55801 [Willisornis vidua]